MFNGFALNNIQNAYVGSTPAQAIYLGNQLIWPTTPPGPHDYSQDYFTIVSLENNNTIRFGVKNITYAQTISVSSDGGNTWTSYTSSEPSSYSLLYGTDIGYLNAGEKLLIKGNNTSYGGSGSLNDGNNYFTATKQYNVEGNIMSLIYGDNFIGQTTLTGSRIFNGLFDQRSASVLENNTKLISAENLILPATTLAEGCYSYMFHWCTRLTTAPVLPAQILVTNCYSYMFRDCSSLNYIKCLATEAESGAFDITNNWVDGVAASGTFVRAANTTWPIGTSGIPSGWVIDPPISHDYSQDYLTFEALESGDITWKAIGTNSPAKTISYSINDGTWTSISSSSAGTNISVSTGDKVRLKGNESSYASSNSIYSGFENQSGAKFNVYGNIMSLIYGDNFIGQTSFNGGTYNLCSIFKKSCVVSAENLILPATTLTDYCYRAMFSNATLLEKAPALPATTLTRYCYYYMFENTKITTAPALPATTLAQSCYFSMFRGCALLTTAPATLPATTLVNYCYQHMFRGCSSLTTAPELPATIVRIDCYNSMFYDCSSLNYIKCLSTDGSSYGKTDWVYNVAASGTFVKNANAHWTTGVSGIPSGWTVQDAT